MTQARSISTLLIDFQSTLSGENVPVSSILEAFHERGFGILLLVFALPMAMPLPVPPGINIMLGSPLLILSAQQMVGRRDVWLPQSWQRKSFTTKTVTGFLNGMIPFLQKMEVLTKPRYVALTGHRAQMIIGALGLIMALTACIPLPLTNTVPSFGIALMALGVLMRDGVAVAIGAFIGTTWVTMLTIAVMLFGTQGIDLMKEAIKSWI